MAGEDDRPDGGTDDGGQGDPGGTGPAGATGPGADDAGKPAAGEPAGGDAAGDDDQGDDGKPAAKPGPDAETKAALAKANREAQERRKQLAAMQKELDDLKAANASESEKALIKARQEAALEAEARWRPQIVQLRADSALQAANVKDPGDRELLLGRIKAADVDLDDQGNVIGGLDGQIAELKERYPKMFTEPAPPRRPTARDVDAGNKSAPEVQKSTGEQLAARLGITK